MSDQKSLALAFLRITELAAARGEVPEGGIDGVWHSEIEASGLNHDWLVWVNAEDEETHVDGPNVEDHDVPSYTATVWYGDHLVAPAAMFGPYGGTQFEATQGDFAEISVEDRLISDIERELDDRGFEYDPEEGG